MKAIIKTIIIIAVCILFLVIDFIVLAGLVYGICWAFNLTFTWKIVFGVWLIIILINIIIKKERD